MAVSKAVENGVLPPVLVTNRNGRSPFVLLCDHASNHIPQRYENLGLGARELNEHIAWDPGTLAVGQLLSQLLDAPLVHSTISRLMIDCNRMHDADDLIPKVSEKTFVPGNETVSAKERQDRIAAFHTPYHLAISDLLDARAAIDVQNIIISLHSFTPVYNDVPRQWAAGLIHAGQEKFSRVLFEALLEDAPEIEMGWNVPYPAREGFYFTIDQHVDKRANHGTIVEIRNDEFLRPSGVSDWAHRLARCLGATLERL